MNSSIRRFLILVVLATVTLCNFIAALHSYQDGMEKSEELLDRQLAQMAAILANSSASHEVIAENGEIAFQVFAPNGSLLLHSPTLPDSAITTTLQGFSWASHGSYRWRTFTLTEKLRGNRIIVAERDDLRHALAEEMVLTSVLPIVTILPILGLLIYLVVSLGLRPLRLLANELEEKKTNDLRPLATSGVPQELSTLVGSINSLLQRLEHSFERERHFSSDAAHELRTPLAALKTHLYHLSSAVPPNHESLPMVNAAVERMNHLIEQMLLLHRTTPDQFTARFEPQDLHAIAEQVIRDHYSRIADKDQNIELAGINTPVTGDLFSLSILIKNLLDNASKYTPPGGSIQVSVASANGKATLAVEDSGPGIPAELRTRVFDRFYRLHGDQHHSGVTGCGLGFSIMQHIVELHHGTITLGESCFPSGLKVTVELPAAPKGESRQ